MFDSIRENKRIAQIILGILIVPFAAFGLNSYFDDGPRGRDVATVGGSPISQNEFERALREQQNRLQEQLGENATEALLNSQEVRQAVLDQLVTQRALALYSRDMRLTVSTEQLQQVIAGVESFQVNGQFSPELYRMRLEQRERGMSPAAFEAMLARDLLVQQLATSIGGSTIVAHGSARRLLFAELEERVVREMRFPVAPHLASIEIGDAAIQKFYDDNTARFELPERVKAEYIVFSEEDLLNKIEISEADIQKAYEEQPEQRRQVRHILIGSAPDADKAATDAARRQAEEIVAILRKEPDRFAALAREKSQDPGSSEMGGDLGFMMYDGTMEPSFEEAVFALEQNKISDPVRTRYGFHILQVTAIQSRPLAEIRDEIVFRLRKKKLGHGFDEKTSKFSDMVFSEAPDSLQPTAEAFGLEIQRTDWIDRGTDTLGGFRNEQIVANLFEDDALERRNNTHAIDVGSNTLVAARVIEHEARRRLPLEEVRWKIEAQLRRDEAMRMAREEGNAALAALDREEADGQNMPREEGDAALAAPGGGKAVNNAWSTSRSFQRSSQDLPPVAARAIFSASLASLPTRVAVELPDDAYVIYQIDSVERPSINDNDPRIAAVARQFVPVLAQSDFKSFLDSLRDRYKVVTKSVANQSAE